MRTPDLELGHGVSVAYVGWGPHEVAGLREFHPCAGVNCRTGGGAPGRCGGGILFDLPGVREAFPNRQLWTLQSLDPLTVAPSLRCGCPGCAHHGFIRQGRWIAVAPPQP